MTHQTQNRSSTAAALERFDWLIEQVRDDVHRSCMFELQGVLGDLDARTATKERALVILGMHASAEANAALQWFDSSGHHRRVRLLHRLALRECKRRRSTRNPRVLSGEIRQAV